MMPCFDSDLQRTEKIQRIQREIIERHYSLPSGILSQRQITHFVSDLNLALWTDAGGVGTHPDYRRRGLGKAVVSALIEHIISEGGVALWSAVVIDIQSIE